MKAVDFINENLDPNIILDYYHFRNVTEVEDSIRSCCEIHKGSNPSAFMWNKSNNLWYCYTGDCHGGDVFTLVQKMEDVDFITSVKRTAEILGIDITNMKIERQADLILKNTMKWLDTMNSICIVNNNRQEYEMPQSRYTLTHPTFNKYSESVLEFYGAKFCKLYPIENGLLYNKLVIPIYFKEVLRGVTLRDTTGKYHPKWFFHPKGLEIRELLYNYDTAFKTTQQYNLTEIILVEGVFDVWAYHEIGIDNVVAIFGSSIKKEQGNILLKSGLDFTTSFDNDDAGNKCTKEAYDMYKFKSDMKTIRLPVGLDPADCKPEELKEYYLNRQ